MRKISPEGVWEDFESQLDEQEQYYQSSWNTLNSAADRKIATENYALTIGVMFEGYPPKVTILKPCNLGGKRQLKAP